MNLVTLLFVVGMFVLAMRLVAYLVLPAKKAEAAPGDVDQ